MTPDPKFPDRPQHPDFARLAAVVCENDQKAETGHADAVMGQIDLPSLVYMAEQRILRVKMLLPPGAPALQALYFDAFFAGMAYARAKDRYEAEK